MIIALFVLSFLPPALSRSLHQTEAAAPAGAGFGCEGEGTEGGKRLNMALTLLRVPSFFDSGFLTVNAHLGVLPKPPSDVRFLRF